MIIRTAITFAVCVTLGRWGYAEIETNAPGLMPAVDYLLEATEIPTHDQWDKEQFSEMYETLGQVKSAFAGERKSARYERDDEDQRSMFRQVKAAAGFERF